MAKENKLDGLENILEIDPDQLDREWIEHPENYFKVAKLLAEAREKHDDCKAQFELTQAELSGSIRDDPKRFKLKKVTEGSVAETVIQQEDYQFELKATNAAKRRVDILQALVHSMDHKKKALEKLVDLFLANYYSVPSKPDDEEGVFEEKTKKSIRKKAKIRRRDRGEQDDD